MREPHRPGPTPAPLRMWPRTSRRGFLQLAGASAALGGLARLPALPAAARELAADAEAGARFFSAEQAEVLTQIVERIVETGEPGAPALRETRAVATIDGLCASLDPALTAPLPTLLRLVDWGPLLFELRPSRFTRLDDASKDASLYGWMTSRFALRRMGFQALRNLAMLGWWSQDETWPLIGYAGPLLQRARSDP